MKKAKSYVIFWKDIEDDKVKFPNLYKEFRPKGRYLIQNPEIRISIFKTIAALKKYGKQWVKNKFKALVKDKPVIFLRIKINR